jgi:hypothetical protein
MKKNTKIVRRYSDFPAWLLKARQFERVDFMYFKDDKTPTEAVWAFHAQLECSKHDAQTEQQLTELRSKAKMLRRQLRENAYLIAYLECHEMVK